MDNKNYDDDDKIEHQNNIGRTKSKCLHIETYFQQCYKKINNEIINYYK